MTAGMDDLPNKPPVDPEELARSLRANMQKRRPGYYRTVATTLGIFALALAVTAWLFWPRPALPRLNLLAFDQVALPGETVPMEAWLMPQDPQVAAPDLGGLDITFAPLPFPPRPGEPSQGIAARTSPPGHVVASVATPAGEGVLDFKIALAASRPPNPTEDRARLFAWKSETPLLLVEVAALADAGSDVWQGRRLVDVAPRKGAAEALQAARAKHYQIVYVATSAPTPLAYRLMRAWMETKTPDAGPFPDGPVLGQLPSSGSPAARDWLARFKGMKRRWPGSFTAVAKNPQLAEILHESGATTFLLTEAAEAPANITRIRSWADLKL